MKETVIDPKEFMVDEFYKPNLTLRGDFWREICQDKIEPMILEVAAKAAARGKRIRIMVRETP